MGIEMNELGSSPKRMWQWKSWQIFHCSSSAQ